MMLRKDKKQYGKITSKDLKKRRIQKRIDEIENKEVKVGPAKESKPKLTDKQIRDKRRGRELIEQKKKQEKPSKIFEVIKEIIKNPYYTGDGLYKNAKSKGGRANLRGGGISQRGLGKAFKNGGKA